MVVTVQGYNGKKSKSAQTACVIAGMLALKENSNTLLLQCINNDVNSVENILYGKNMTRKFGADETDFSDSGIDALLRSVGSTKIRSDEFERYCTALTKVKNRLDITECTRTTVLEQTILTQEEELGNIVSSAVDIYDNVIILGPCDAPETTEMLNKFADLSLYCITQGHKASGKAYGKKIYYVVTDFEETSTINLGLIRKEYRTGGFLSPNNVLKISRNVSVRDAAITGTLLTYIRDNRECSEFESHYEWYKDIQKIMDMIAGQEDEENAYNWERRENGTYEFGDLGKQAVADREKHTVAVTGKKQGFFERLFGRMKESYMISAEEIGSGEYKKHIPSSTPDVVDFDQTETADTYADDLVGEISTEIKNDEDPDSEEFVYGDDETFEYGDELENEENPEAEKTSEEESKVDPEPEKPVKKVSTRKTAVKKTASTATRAATKTATKTAATKTAATKTAEKKTTTAKAATTKTAAKSTTAKTAAKSTTKKATTSKDAGATTKTATTKTTAKKTTTVKAAAATKKSTATTTTKKTVKKADEPEEKVTVKKTTKKAATASKDTVEDASATATKKAATKKVVVKASAKESEEPVKKTVRRTAAKKTAEPVEGDSTEKPKRTTKTTKTVKAVKKPVKAEAESEE